VFAGGKDEATKGVEVFTEDQLDDVRLPCQQQRKGSPVRV
jgi:hypothetical protein